MLVVGVSGTDDSTLFSTPPTESSPIKPEHSFYRRLEGAGSLLLLHKPAQSGGISWCSVLRSRKSACNPAQRQNLTSPQMPGMC